MGCQDADRCTRQSHKEMAAPIWHKIEQIRDTSRRETRHALDCSTLHLSALADNFWSV